MNWMERLGGRVPSSTMLGNIFTAAAVFCSVLALSSSSRRSEKVVIEESFWLGTLWLNVFSNEQRICG